MFDGVGAPHHIIQELFGTPRLSIDRACCKVMNARTSRVVQRGDISKEDAQSVVDLIGKADPNAEAVIVWTAAPPCQDFSRITDGPGHQGERGSLFLTTVELMQKIRCLSALRRFGFLYENVVMQPIMADDVSNAGGPTGPSAGLPLGEPAKAVVDSWTACPFSQNFARDYANAPWHYCKEAMMQESSSYLLPISNISCMSSRP